MWTAVPSAAGHGRLLLQYVLRTLFVRRTVACHSLPGQVPLPGYSADAAFDFITKHGLAVRAVGEWHDYVTAFTLSAGDSLSLSLPLSWSVLPAQPPAIRVTMAEANL